MSERQTMTRECTCLGTCKGPEGLALGWRCALGRSPECRDNRRRMHEGEVTGDVVKTAIDRAVERFGDRGDGLFNAAGFGVALMELAGLKGVIDGTLVRAILSGRADVAMELDASHFRRIVGLCRDPRCRIEREHTATLHNLPGGELNGRVAPAAPAPAVEGEPTAHEQFPPAAGPPAPSLPRVQVIADELFENVQAGQQAERRIVEAMERVARELLRMADKLLANGCRADRLVDELERRWLGHHQGDGKGEGAAPSKSVQRRLSAQRETADDKENDRG